MVVIYDPAAEAWKELTMQPYLPVDTTSTILIKMLGAQTMARAAGMLLPFGRLPVAAISGLVFASIRSLTVFSVNEQLEGLLLGYKCVEAIDAMVEGHW
jgi:hypothetical protein